MSDNYDVMVAPMEDRVCIGLRGDDGTIVQRVFERVEWAEIARAISSLSTDAPRMVLRVSVPSLDARELLDRVNADLRENADTQPVG